jgi:mRNA-degrading endonuclease toxin of MazEF toxin-antitoxin module
MIDKIVSVPRDSVDALIGRCDDAELDAVDAALRRWLALS